MSGPMRWSPVSSLAPWCHPSKCGEEENLKPMVLYPEVESTWSTWTWLNKYLLEWNRSLGQRFNLVKKKKKIEYTFFSNVCPEELGAIGTSGLYFPKIFLAFIMLVFPEECFVKHEFCGILTDVPEKAAISLIINSRKYYKILKFLKNLAKRKHFHFYFNESCPHHLSTMHLYI